MNLHCIRTTAVSVMILICMTAVIHAELPAKGGETETRKPTAKVSDHAELLKANLGRFELHPGQVSRR